MIKKAFLVAVAALGVGLLGSPAHADSAPNKDLLDTQLFAVTVKTLADNTWNEGNGNISGAGNIGGNGNNVGNNNNGGNGNSNGGAGNIIGPGNHGGNGSGNSVTPPWVNLVG
ncbi:hypothetical protein [Saccharothrix obliqua]|uniref:hypothetical protein n=1 Tax=Saccharothrix obliqua TaxID=2861747 RepID=UPI001C5F8439|nr:hypothetical protein [Saccharothrix obliqua]MBW4716534.1 hypothetical protein [Saccharothrix obliqua]